MLFAAIFNYCLAPRLPTLRRLTIRELLYFLGVRVFWPLPVGLPQADLARRRPRPWRPSPPPCGWSTGFMAVPRTVGRTPFHRIRPAFPSTLKLRSGFDTAPKVARQS